jgi:pyruvate kinase
VAVSSQEATCQSLQFSAGIYPIHEAEHPENWKPFIKKWLQDHAISGELAFLTEGPSTKYPHMNHRMEIINLAL